jgi:GDPmannose 4,6-dehydratase
LQATAFFSIMSPRAGVRPSSRARSHALASIKAGKQRHLYLGNLDSRRDWGYAPEYVEGMWMILQQDEPDDWVLGTGESHTVREFLDESFGYADMDWNEYVKIDPRYFRPTEVNFLQADDHRTRQVLGWAPKISFKGLVRIMVDADLELQGLESPGEGKQILEKEFTGWHRWEHQVTSMEGMDRKSSFD